MSKYKVSRNYRTSDLSNSDSQFEVEFHHLDGRIKCYDNVHFPNGFISKAFDRDSSIKEAVVIDVSDGSKTIVGRDGI